MDYTTHKSGNFGDGLFFGLSGLPHYCICIFLLFPMWNERTCQVGNTQSVWLSKSGSYNAALVHQVLTNWKVKVRQQFWRHVCQIMEFLYSFFTSPFGDKREAKQFPELPWGKMRRPRPRLHPRGRQGMGHLLQWCPGSENKKDIFKKPGLGLIVDNGWFHLDKLLSW